MTNKVHAGESIILISDPFWGTWAAARSVAADIRSSRMLSATRNAEDGRVCCDMTKIHKKWKSVDDLRTEFIRTTTIYHLNDQYGSWWWIICLDTHLFSTCCMFIWSWMMFSTILLRILNLKFLVTWCTKQFFSRHNNPSPKWPTRFMLVTQSFWYLTRFEGRKQLHEVLLQTFARVECWVLPAMQRIDVFLWNRNGQNP